MSETPAVPAAAPAVPGKTLGIVSIVVAFFAALIGLILAIVAKSQSKKAGVKNTPATVGLVLSIIFLVIQAIIIGSLVAGGTALFNQCAQYGPGVHTLENGVTLTCG